MTGADAGAVERRGAKKDDQYVILDRRLKVARLYLKGHTQLEIGNELGVAQTTVSNDLAAIRKGWEASAILDWDEAKSKELAALDLQEQELWKAWQRSCEVETVRTRSVTREVRDVREGKGKESKVVGTKLVPTEVNSKKVDKQLIGDPRYMAEITKIRELRCKILGFLKDEKPQQNTQVNIINWDAVAAPMVDEIEQRLAIEEAKTLKSE